MTKSSICECPRCKQGSVLAVKVIKNGRIIYLCDECEAVWFCKDSIEYATFNYFNYYMERLGLPDDWDQLEILDSDLHPSSTEL